MLAALASSMGVRPNLLQQAIDDADTIGTAEGEFNVMMKDRAAAFDKADLDFNGKLDFEEYKAMVKYRESKDYTEKQLREKSMSSTLTRVARLSNMNSFNTRFVRRSESLRVEQSISSESGMRTTPATSTFKSLPKQWLLLAFAAPEPTLRRCFGL